MPCWLDGGWIDGGCKKCGLAKSAQDCLTYKVFEQINGDRETLNAIFLSIPLAFSIRNCPHLEKSISRAGNHLPLQPGADRN